MVVGYTLDPELGWVPAIPEPFWYSSWRTWFRMKPSCYHKNCRRTTWLDGDVPMLFENRKEWETHYVLNHLQEDLEHEGNQDKRS